MEELVSMEPGENGEVKDSMPDTSPIRKSRKKDTPATAPDPVEEKIIRGAILQQSLHDADKDARVVVKELDTPTGKRPFLIMMTDQFELDGTGNFVPVLK